MLHYRAFRRAAECSGGTGRRAADRPALPRHPPRGQFPAAVGAGFCAGPRQRDYYGAVVPRRPDDDRNRRRRAGRDGQTAAGSHDLQVQRRPGRAVLPGGSRGGRYFHAGGRARTFPDHAGVHQPHPTGPRRDALRLSQDGGRTSFQRAGMAVIIRSSATQNKACVLCWS